jgi:hypothetical protein
LNNPERFKAPFIPKERVWQEAEKFRAAYPAGRKVPVQVLELAEFDLALDLIPAERLREQLEIDALLMGDLKSILVDFRLNSWLRGDRYSPGGEGGVLPLIPLDDIWKWVDANREKRAWYLASFVPKQLFRSTERPCLAREVLIRYGSDPTVRNNLTANFSTEGWSGPASAHYQEKEQQLLAFKKEETDANVRLWIDEYVAGLQAQIDQAKIREEREAF